MAVADSLLANYAALILVIILWVAVWSIADTLGSLYLRNHSDRLVFYGSVAAATSLILLVFFPQHMFL